MKAKAFLDLETTGLDPIENEIIEVAIIRDGRHGPDYMRSLHNLCLRSGGPLPKCSLTNGTLRWETKIEVQRPEKFTDKVREINSYNEEEWAGAPRFTTVAPVVQKLLENAIMIGSNPEFDRAFLNYAFEEIGVGLGYIRTVDTHSLSWEHLSHCNLQSAGLSATCEVLGIKMDSRHRAMPDTEMARKAYYKLLRAGPIKRAWWSIQAKRRRL